MTENEARNIVANLVEPAGIARLERLAELVVDENTRQNLIAPSTVARIWSRHILDSVQLLAWAETGEELWLDIGTGGGFPGLAIAAVSARRIVLAEPRRHRAEFLARAAHALGLSHVEIVQQKVERLTVHAGVISARAVSPIERLIGAAIHCATPGTCWLMPRGAGYDEDMRTAQAGWRGMFHVEQSLSDPSAGIIVATGVASR